MGGSGRSEWRHPFPSVCPPPPSLQFFLWLFGQLGIMGGLYVFGATLYALRLPERLRPGSFDILVRPKRPARELAPFPPPPRPRRGSRC